MRTIVKILHISNTMRTSSALVFKLSKPKLLLKYFSVLFSGRRITMNTCTLITWNQLSITLRDIDRVYYTFSIILLILFKIVCSFGWLVGITFPLRKNCVRKLFHDKFLLRAIKAAKTDEIIELITHCEMSYACMWVCELPLPPVLVYSSGKIYSLDCWLNQTSAFSICC